jgi:lysophospholipid hydrolase
VRESAVGGEKDPASFMQIVRRRLNGSRDTDVPRFELDPKSPGAPRSRRAQDLVSTTAESGATIQELDASPVPRSAPFSAFATRQDSFQSVQSITPTPTPPRNGSFVSSASNHVPSAARPDQDAPAGRLGTVARATEDSTLAVIPAEAFRRLTKKFPKASAHIVQGEQQCSVSFMTFLIKTLYSHSHSPISRHFYCCS